MILIQTQAILKYKRVFNRINLSLVKEAAESLQPLYSQNKMHARRETRVKPNLSCTSCPAGCPSCWDVTAAMSVHSASCLVPKVPPLTSAWAAEDTHSRTVRKEEKMRRRANPISED